MVMECAAIPPGKRVESAGFSNTGFKDTRALGCKDPKGGIRWGGGGPGKKKSMGRERGKSRGNPTRTSYKGTGWNHSA